MIASGINIGRRRGEFEQATKVMRSIAGAHRDPRVSGVCEMGRLADLLARGAAKFCSQDKGGRHANGVPDEAWLRRNAVDEAHTSGFTGRPLDHQLMHVFMCETADLTIRGGHVFRKMGDRVLAWCEPDLFAHLGTGYRLTIRFDPSEPTLGAAVFNREVGSRNRDDFKLGQFLGLAEYAPECPQIVTGLGLMTPEEEAALTHKKRHDAAVRCEYRAIGIFGKRTVRISEERDGRGNVVRVERGAKPLLETRVAVDAGADRVGVEAAPSVRGYRNAPPRREVSDADVDRMTEESEALEAKLRARGALMPM